MPFDWKAEGVEARLTKLWTEDGLSAAKIASDLSALTGVLVTRNAVIGRIARLGLKKVSPEEKPEPVKLAQSLAEPAARRAIARHSAPLPDADPAPVSPLPVREEVERDPRDGVSIIALRLGQCRFPITPHHAPTHFFCAAAVEAPGATYCSEHAAACFDRRTSQERRADQERAARARAGKEAA